MRMMLAWIGAGALLAVCFGAGLPGRAAEPPALDDQTRIQIEALERLKGMDLEANPALQRAVLAVVQKTRGTPHFVELVRDFGLKGQSEALLEYALQHPAESSGVEAFRLAHQEAGPSRVEPLLASTNAVAAVQLMGASGDRGLLRRLEALVPDSAIPAAPRKAAVRALAQRQDGARFLLDLAREDKLPADLRFAASSELHLAPWPEIKKQALEILPLPQGQGAEALPPVGELMKLKGDARRGSEVFRRAEVACIACHQVNGEGLDFGPKLSEIGTKLGKDALYESILDPSAGIAFGYEAWSVDLANGDELFGLIVSETADDLALKAQTGIVTKVKKAEIARRVKMATSIMPAGLQLTLSTQELVDLVEYLAQLRKPATP